MAAYFLGVVALSLHAEDWKTTDGKVYQDVTVIKSEPDAVTILYRDGGALVPLTHLPPDLQKRFNYDPDQAEKAAVARAQADAKSVAALQAEAVLAKKLKADEKAAEKTNAAKPPPSPIFAAGADPTHPTEGDLMHDDRNDPAHHDEGYPMRNEDNHNTTGESHPFKP